MAIKFFTREEVGTYLRVNPRTVDRWLKKGLLKGFKLGDGPTSKWRIPEGEVTKFLEKHASTKQNKRHE